MSGTKAGNVYGYCYAVYKAEACNLDEEQIEALKDPGTDKNNVVDGMDFGWSDAEVEEVFYYDGKQDDDNAVADFKEGYDYAELSESDETVHTYSLAKMRVDCDRWHEDDIIEDVAGEVERAVERKSDILNAEYVDDLCYADMNNMEYADGYEPAASLDDVIEEANGKAETHAEKAPVLPRDEHER